MGNFTNLVTHMKSLICMIVVLGVVDFIGVCRTPMYSTRPFFRNWHNLSTWIAKKLWRHYVTTSRLFRHYDIFSDSRAQIYAMVTCISRSPHQSPIIYDSPFNLKDWYTATFLSYCTVDNLFFYCDKITELPQLTTWHVILSQMKK